MGYFDETDIPEVKPHVNNADGGFTQLVCQIFFYIVVIGHFFYYRKFDVLKRLIGGNSLNKLIENRANVNLWGLIFREYHSISVFTSFLFFIYFPEYKCLSYIIGSILVFILWDGGIVYLSNDMFHSMLISLHHVGSVLALIDNNISIERQWYNTYFFTWLWFIHSFKELQNVLIYIFNMKFEAGKENDPVPVFGTLRHIYAFGSVYFFYLITCGKQSPPLLQNRQALYAVIMIFGRLFACWNFQRIPHLKTVENPGYVLVIMHALLSTGHETIAWISAFSLALIFILNDIYNKPLVESKSEFQGL